MPAIQDVYDHYYLAFRDDDHLPAWVTIIQGLCDKTLMSHRGCCMSKVFGGLAGYYHFIA